jgi:hypothetical protein
MNARLRQIRPSDAEIRNDDGQHSLKRHRDQLVVAVRVSCIITRMGMHLREDDDAVILTSTHCLTETLFTDKHASMRMLGARHNDGCKHGQRFDLQACPKRKALVASLSETGEGGFNECVSCVGHDRLWQQEAANQLPR